jgi:hypothetical protein
MVKKVNTSNIWPTRPYTIDEVVTLLSVSKTTVLTWIGSGLRALKTHQPYLIIGSDLKAFLNDRVRTTAYSTGHLFVCMKCRVGREPAGNMIDYYHGRTGNVRIMALCCICETPMSAFIGPSKLAALGKKYELVLTLRIQDEASKEIRTATTQVRKKNAARKK